MKSVIVALTAAWLVGPVVARVEAEPWRGGIGVVGDSYSDEYAFYPPHRSLARNWVEVLATLRGLDFGPYSATSRGEPRNQGYAYNWARSAATTDDMLAQGQHTGVAGQVARGEVGLVCVFVGGNDLIEALRQPDAAAALDAAVRRARDNLEVAVRTILEAGDDVKILLATVPDLCELPEIAELGTRGSEENRRVEAASRAVVRYNARIWSIAGSDPRLAVADLHLGTRLARVLSPRFVPVGGRQIVRAGCGDDVDHVFLADRRHVGTAVHGLLARVLVAAMNRHLGVSLEAPTDIEVLDLAVRAAGGSLDLAAGSAAPASLAVESDGPPLGR